jgi:hypothetical protein
MNTRIMPMMLSKDFLLFTSGILLISFSAVNVKISPAPANIKDIFSETNKTYCIKVKSVDTESDNRKKEITDSCNNAYILMVLSFTIGIFLVLISMPSFFVLLSVNKKQQKK